MGIVSCKGGNSSRNYHLSFQSILTTKVDYRMSSVWSLCSVLFATVQAVQYTNNTFPIGVTVAWNVDQSSIIIEVIQVQYEVPHKWYASSVANATTYQRDLDRAPRFQKSS